MRFFNKTKIDFVSKRKTAFVLSALIILAGLVSLVLNGGPNYNIDFTGGLSLEIDLNKDGVTTPTADELRDALTKKGFADLEIQTSEYEGRQFFIIKSKEEKFEDKLVAALKAQFTDLNSPQIILSETKIPQELVYNFKVDLSTGSGKQLNQDDVQSALKSSNFTAATVTPLGNNSFDLQGVREVGSRADEIINAIKVSFPSNVGENLVRLQQEIGPRVGDELKDTALWAIIFSLIGIIVYIWFRFELTYGIAAVIALFHDVLITVGVFSLMGKEISLAVVAALLTIVGYSLNDTIVVFDRIREDMKIYRKENYTDVINHSINETLSRTIITSLTTFVVVLSLFLFGGQVIHDFAFALLVGVIVGTYSSIFIASPVLVFHYRRVAKRNSK